MKGQFQEYSESFDAGIQGRDQVREKENVT